MPQLLRKGHFLGTKLRSVRKRNGLTLEELSARCIQRNPRLAPSVSYLSMIESGKRSPSAELLELLAPRTRGEQLQAPPIEPAVQAGEQLQRQRRQHLIGALDP